MHILVRAAFRSQTILTQALHIVQSPAQKNIDFQEKRSPLYHELVRMIVAQVAVRAIRLQMCFVYAPR